MLKNKEEVNMTKKITIAIRSHIDVEDIKNLLDSASRGSAYWCDDCDKFGYESATNVVVNPDGGMIALHDSEQDGKYYEVNYKVIKKGLTVMAKKYPQTFADFINGDYDLYTGDTFLQCCLFGEEIYG